MRIILSGVALFFSTTLYFLAYQAYWHHSNMRPWLSEVLIDIYFFFAYPKQSESTEVTVQATGNIVIFEDNVIFYSFLSSLLIALAVFFSSILNKNKLQKTKLNAGFAAYSVALIVMNTLFLANNQLRI